MSGVRSGNSVWRTSLRAPVPAVGSRTMPFVPLSACILVDNHNYARFLPDCLDSALAQTHPHVEVLVVDDGSTDDSAAVLASYGTRISVLQRENGGQAAAVNAALRLVTADVTIVLDSDDALLPDTVARVVAEMRRDPECVRVQYRLAVVDADGTPTGAVVPPRRVPLPAGDLRPLLLRHRGFRWPPTSGNAWSTAALRQLPPVPEDTFRQHLDRWWSDLVPLLGTVRTLDGVGGRYRVHGANDSQAGRRSADWFRVRVERRHQLHAAGAQVAAAAGLRGYPSGPEKMWDAAYVSWLLACRRLDPTYVPAAAAQGRGRRAVVRGHLRALAACARQPDKPFATRARHVAWYLAVLASRPGSRLARLLVARRYDVDRD